MATTPLEWAQQLAVALDSLRAVLSKMITEWTPVTPPANHPPTITITGPATGVAGTTLSYQAVTADPDNDTVAVAWTINSQQAGAGTTLSLPAPAAGTYTIQATASDGKGGTAASAPVTVTVTPVVTPPTTTRGLLPTFKPGPKADYAVFPIPGAVQVATTQSLATLVASAAPGTIFELASGTHTIAAEIRPKARMQFIGHADTVLDGKGATLKAFVADWGNTPANVVLANFTLTNCKQPSSPTGNGTKLKAETCAIQALDTVQYTSPYAPGRDPSGGWQLKNLAVTKCTGGAFLGSGGQALDCSFTDNDQIGLKLWGDGQLVAGCDMSRNNVAGNFDTWYEAGGMKSWKGNNHVITNCRANGNTGSGIWLDYTGSGALITHCEANVNTGPGISLETSMGPVVSQCMVLGNLGDAAANGKDWINGGINVYSSPKVRIEDNTIEGGVVFQVQDRGLTGWNAHPNGADAATAGEMQTGCYGARVLNNTISVTGIQWSGERFMVQTDFTPYAVATPARVRELLADMIWSGNTWSGGAEFSYVDTGASLDASVWNAGNRHYIGLTAWKALGRS